MQPSNKYKQPGGILQAHGPRVEQRRVVEKIQELRRQWNAGQPSHTHLARNPRKIRREARDIRRNDELAERARVAAEYNALTETA